MTLGDILKGTLKVVGSAGLLIASGMAKSAAGVVEQNGNDSGLFDELSDKCMKQLDKMWAGDDYEEPSEFDEYKRQSENIDKKERRVESLIKKTESLAKEAKRDGNTELYEGYMQKIEDYRARMEDIKKERRQLFDDYYHSNDDDSSSNCEDD